MVVGSDRVREFEKLLKQYNGAQGRHGYYNFKDGIEIASAGERDPDAEGVEKPTEYADWTKYYAAQSVARYDLLRNQEGTLKIPCNPLICAGDKIDLRFQSKLSDTLQTKKAYDTESSGIYLVKEVTHTFNFVNSGTSGKGYTTIRLFRDSYGSDIEPSNYGE